MRTLVIGDIHGAKKALDQCMQRAGFDVTQDTLISLGDICDGHRETFECVETLLAIPNLIAIKGNHDAWLHSFIETDFHPVYWTYGGVATIISYLHHAGKPGMYRASRSGYKTALVAEDIPEAHRIFFDSQKLFHVDINGRCYVHGGFNRELPLYRQRNEDFYWNRELWDEAYASVLSGEPEDSFPMVPQVNEIFLGHTPTTNWDSDHPLHAFNIWNLDTGAGHSGRLTIMDVNTKEYWQSDPLPELYPERFNH